MTDLLQDTWHDLRQKRLWPIAVVLLIGVVAIPALLTKSAAQPPPADPVAAAPGPNERAVVTLADGDAASTGTGSPLDEFAKGDPFTPPTGIAKAAGDTATTAAAPDPPGGGGAPDDGGSETGGGDGGSPAPSPPGPPIDPPTTRTEQSEYEYIADVTFWTGDSRREIRGLRKLEMLPSQRAPVLIFMGTTGEGGNAVFLVDSTLRAAGEGRCVPSPANCAYVHVGPGSEHAFTTAEGDSYRLRIDEIRRVEVRPTASRSARPSARTSAGRQPAARRFALPSLVDLVAVTETHAVDHGDASVENRSSIVADGR